MDDYLLTGLWRVGEGTRYVWYGAVWPSFEQKARELAAGGLALCSFDVSQAGEVDTWSGVWEPSRAVQEFASGLVLEDLLQRNVVLAERGLILVCMRSHGGRKPRAWAGLWRTGTSISIVVGPVVWSQFWSAWLAQHAAGRRLIDFDTFDSEGVRYWSGVWRPGTGDQFIWVNAMWTEFSAKNRELLADGYELLTLRSYPEGAIRRWGGCWRKTRSRSSLAADMTESQFWTEFDAQLVRGLRLASVHNWVGTGYAPMPAIRVRLRLFLKILFSPSIPIAIMLDRMREVYEPVGVQVEVASMEDIDRPELVDVNVGACTQSVITGEQQQLFAARNNASDRDIAVYFVRSTLPPYNGCAAHPAGQPGLVIASYATEWTLAHEVGHVLGLVHIADSRRLMTGLGTANIIDPPPDLSPEEVRIILSSKFVNSL